MTRDKNEITQFHAAPQRAVDRNEIGPLRVRLRQQWLVDFDARKAREERRPKKTVKSCYEQLCETVDHLLEIENAPAREAMKARVLETPGPIHGAK